MQGAIATDENNIREGATDIDADSKGSFFRHGKILRIDFFLQMMDPA